MKVRWVAVAACVIFAVTVGFSTWALAEDAPAAKAAVKAHSYVGAAKCKMCHASPAKGNQAKLWADSVHAKAFAVLATPEAKVAAEKAGVTGNPQESDKCLACHVTGFSAPKEQKAATWKAEDGVTCEACHGPGADYMAMPVMKDKAAAKAAGLLPVTEATCTACHNKNSPTFKGFVFAEMAKKIAHPNPLNKKP
jgi:cytochrome c5